MAASSKPLGSKPLERDIQQDIRIALGLEDDLTLWRNSAGVFDTYDERNAHGRKVRAGLVVGASDLLGILDPNGRWFALEIKTDRGRVTTEQQQFLDLIRRRGGFAAVVRSVDEAKQALQRARRGERE